MESPTLWPQLLDLTSSNDMESTSSNSLVIYSLISLSFLFVAFVLESFKLSKVLDELSLYSLSVQLSLIISLVCNVC